MIAAGIANSAVFKSIKGVYLVHQRTLELRRDPDISNPVQSRDSKEKMNVPYFMLSLLFLISNCIMP